MTENDLRGALSRRQLMAWAAGGVAAGVLPLAGHAGDDGAKRPAATSPGSAALSETALTGKQVVVIGGGMAGMTAAKYLRLWGGRGVRVTLVEPEALYTSNIMSNLVLNGSRNVASLQFKRDALARKYGVVLRPGAVTAIDPAARRVTLADATTLAYDRLVLAPGVSFDEAYGLTQADYDARTPHAWRAGAQTTLLADQISAMSNGGTFVMTIPKAPYRCPPGPYERACVVADWLKKNKGPACRVIVLDENASIQAERHTFELAFSQIHAGIIQYLPATTGIAIDAATRRVSFVDQLGAPQSVQAQVVNPIPPHRAAGSAAGGWLAKAGLANGTDGRWAVVDVLSYESTAPGCTGIHVIGDASSCGMPKAGHVANQEGKICADAIVRLLGNTAPDPQPVANSACFSPITASTASWLSAVYQYDATERKMKVASNGGKIVVDGAPAVPTEAAKIDSDNFKNMGTWFTTLMGDTLG